MTGQRRLLLLSAVAAVTALSGCRSSGDEPILIGLAGPFSQPRGASMRLAAELAVEEINQNGGVRGRVLQLVVRDDSARSDAAVRIAQELYDTPGLVTVIGHLNSGATLAAAPIYNGGARPLVELSPSASTPRLSNAGSFTFRMCPDDLTHGTRLAEWAWHRLGARTAAVIYQNDDYGRGVRTTFANSFTELGGTILAEDPYMPSTPTFEPYLRRLVLRGGGAVDALMIAGTREGAERLLQTADSVGLDAAVLGGDGLAGLQAADLNVEGVLISSAYLPDRPGARNEAFVEAYRRAFSDQVPDHRGAGAYDAVYLLARAITATGTGRTAIRDYLAGVGTRTEPFEGVTGTIAFDANGDVPDKDVVIGVVNGGRLLTAPGQ